MASNSTSSASSMDALVSDLNPNVDGRLFPPTSLLLELDTKAVPL